MGSPITYLRVAAPAHYKFQVENFSSLAKSNITKYESRTFSVGGYKWALVLYPNGNKSGKGHISLDLELADKGSVANGVEILVDAKMFIFDQDKDKYLTIQDSNNVWRYHDAKTKWGFDKLISLEYLKDSNKGYIVNNSCIFGVELFIVKNTGKGETLKIYHPPNPVPRTWKIQNYSGLDEKKIYQKDVYNIGGSQWKLCFHPKGDRWSRGKKITLFLEIVDPSTIRPEKIMYMEYYLRVKNQFAHHDDYETKVTSNFSTEHTSWGKDLLTLKNVKDLSKGWLVNDVLTLELKVTGWSRVNDFN